MTKDEVVATMYRAFELNKTEKYADALDAFLIVGKNTEEQRTEDERQVYVCSQTMACACYSQIGQYESGYLLAKQMLQGRLTENEKKDVCHQYAFNGYMFACDLLKRDESGHAQYKRGRGLLQELVPYADELLLEYLLPKIPLSFYFEGAEYSLSHKYNEALSCYQQSLQGFEDLGNIENSISVLKAIASVKYRIYDVEGAMCSYNQALVLSRKIGDVTLQMEILKELCQLSRNTGNMELVLNYSATMDSIVEVNEDAQVKFVYYGQKGDEAVKLEQYDLAEQWYLKETKIAETSKRGSISSNKHIAYSNLRNLYARTGKYDKAILYGRKAIDEYQRQLPVDDNNYYMPYMAMSEIYAKRGDREKCMIYLDSLFLGEKRMDEARELYLLYMTRARCHANLNDYSSALEDYKKADEILATKYPQSDGDRVILLALIGGAEHQTGNYVESERYYKLYAEQIQKLYGEKSLEYINAQIYLANAEGFAEQIEEGCQDYMMAINRLKDLIKSRFLYLSPSERESFWLPISSLYTLMTPYALKAELYQTLFTRSCYDGLVMSKAFLLDAERSLYDIVKRSGRKEDMHDYMMLSIMKSQIKEWEKDYTHFADSILGISQKISRMERLLLERLHCRGESYSFMNIDYDAVKGVLEPDETLIDFTDFVSVTSERKYAAYIINTQQNYPLLKPLFIESQIDSLGISRPDMYYDMDYASSILDLLWTPLKEHVAEGSTVYYIPSQLLFQISLESLPLADGSLLGNHYNFVRLSSARELVRFKRKALAFTPKSAVLYGGLQYDLEPMTMTEESKRYDLSDLCLVMRGDMVRGDSIFHELPASKEEIITIESILKRKNIQVTSYMDTRGTEESFLNMHGQSPHILQIATHGFYYTPNRAENVEFLKGYKDAMSLSGLVMSGGNAAWLGKELPYGVLGGILTANTISRMDLSRTELVVLSACQTGQGQATAEGLYGMQRAFKKAGVGTMVMALWNVSDKVTTEFMITFYEQLVNKKNNWNKRRAFENAKNIIRQKYHEPFYWAAFVMLD